MDGEESATKYEQTEATVHAGEVDNDEKRESRVSHLPSPPLTRVGTRESDKVGDNASVSGAKEEARDLPELGMDASPETTDATEEEGGAGHSAGENSSPSKSLRLNPTLHPTIRPPSPQPWELIDPPESVDHTEGVDRYQTANSKTFETSQKQDAPRPLIPKSAYYFGPPPPDSAYGTPPIGQIGLHHPREVLRIERDYTGGELIQFAPIYPLELGGRITPTQFLESINAINELLISAHSLRHAFLDNILAVFTLQLSPLFLTSHYEKEMRRLKLLFQYLNEELYNPVGLNILWPRNVAFLFLEIEYY